MRSFLIIFLFVFVNFSFSQQWKEMANDINVNVYDVVVAEAESYFKNIDISKKGSGWKAYNRWLYENEPKFYPSGDRNTVESNFAAKEFKNFVSNNPSYKKSLFDDGWEELGPHYIEEVTGHYAVGLGRIESFTLIQTMKIESWIQKWWVLENAGWRRNVGEYYRFFICIWCKYHCCFTR